MIFVFIDSIFHSFGQPLTFGVSTVPKVKKEQQKDTAVAQNDVQKDGKLVVAILHEKELAYVDADNNELDLKDESLKVLLSLYLKTHNGAIVRSSLPCSIYLWLQFTVQPKSLPKGIRVGGVRSESR